jgi:uroporphyrin-III C-methyltransferase/precorrin-2 dehydrogenase/sirohydrochlorin ferrochelatase
VRYLPVFLDVQGRKAVVLGEGEVAERKAAALRRAGAEVRVAPRFAAGLLDGCALAVGADAPEPELLALSQAAQARGVPVNVVDRPTLCSYITPAIVDRDPLIVAIGSGGEAPVLARMIRQRIEAMLPLSLSRLASLAGSFAAELRARLPDPAARRPVIERMLSGRAADLVELGDEDGARAEMRRELEGAQGDPPGVVYLVTAVEGAPDLLTLRAHRLLGEADVIVHAPDMGEDILDLARRDAGRIAAGEAEARAALLLLATEGKRAVWLRLRAPSKEDLAALARVRYEIVPSPPAASGRDYDTA